MQPLRLILDGEALVANWRWFRDTAGVPAAAAVKADGYGLGAREVARRLHAAGCRTFAVSSVFEAQDLGLPGPDCVTLILHGFLKEDAAAIARMPWVRPVLNTPHQVASFAAAFPGRTADLMVETGMNRLGLERTALAAALEAVPVDTIHSHLAAADEPGHPQTSRQRDCFAAIAAATPGHAHALANSAGVCCGPGFAFSLVRPGLGIYGGMPHPAARVRPVLRIEARVLQVKLLAQGACVGYGATWRAPGPSRVATLNLGYADGVFRQLAPLLAFEVAGVRCPVIGRISMDLIAADVTGADVTEGDFLPLSFELPALAAASGFSQYEVLVSLSRRFERRWQ